MWYKKLSFGICFVLIWLLVILIYGVNLLSFKYGSILCLLLAAAIIDIKTRTIPNAITVLLLPLSIIGFCINSVIGLIPAVILFITSYFSNGGIGGGDIKLTAALGLNLGLYNCLYSLILGLLLLVILNLLKPNKKKQKTYPLAPYIFIGTLALVISINLEVIL